ISYYDDKYGEGMNYGYIYPAITKTMQNAGRCIRSETDRGVVVFMDARYTWEHYAKCFPPEWKMQITKRWAERVRSFFA
ncbi:MAG: helicase C-terminal domain-containing protein, partial [Nanoarchaeota archaeon]|nr:helicase C-terminal domain-containing protein [Nanoarchaeota archaeon]